jgi:hypothetical protein
MADGPAALGWPEVNSIFSDFFQMELTWFNQNMNFLISKKIK